MNRLLILMLSFGLILESSAQSDKKNQIDVSTYLFVNSEFRFSQLEGAGYVENGGGCRFGLQYSRLITDKIWLNIGLGYLKSSNVFHGAFIGPMNQPKMVTQEAFIIQVPIRIKVDALKWLYFKGGLTIDRQLNNPDGTYIDNQSGIGVSLLGGVDITITQSTNIVVEPELVITSLIPFNETKYPQHLLLTGIAFGFGYHF